MQTCSGCKQETVEDNDYGHFCAKCTQEMNEGYRGKDALDAIFGDTK